VDWRTGEGWNKAAGWAELRARQLSVSVVLKDELDMWVGILERGGAKRTDGVEAL
jgi:hypothetical protein